MLDLDKIFSDLKPRTSREAADLKELKEAAKTFCRTIWRLSPQSADQNHAIRLVREACWSTEQAILLDGTIRSRKRC